MSVELGMVIRLLAAAGLGAVIGYQRERSGKPAGLRTHVLIAIGSALFTIASVYGFIPVADPARVAAGVVAGIGFIGAGAIIHRGGGDIITGPDYGGYYVGGGGYWSGGWGWFIRGRRGYHGHYPGGFIPSP